MEDDEAVRFALAVRLRREGYEVCALADGCTLKDIVESFRPDLGLLDIALPVGPDGYAVARQLRAETDIPVLFLTAADSLESKMAGFDLGADDYILKPFAMPEVLARVRVALRRSGRVDSAICHIADLVVDDASRTATRAGFALDLTPTEFDLLSALAHRRGRVVSKLELLSDVWGFDAYDGNLVEVHVSSLRHKLEARGRRLIHTRRGAGYELRL